MPSRVPAIAFIGGGPRTAGVLERLAANRPALFAGPLEIHVIEPHEPGSGRIWRYDQDPGLLLNSTAADVTMFTDASVACEGPPVEGPGLSTWAAGVLDGSIRDVPALEPHLLDQLRALTPSSFPTRQLQSKYLEWFYRRAVSNLGPDAKVTVHRDTATGVVRSSADSGAASTETHDDAPHHVQLASGTEVVADVVVYALGHTDSVPDPESARLSEFAARHGGFHAPPSYTTDVDYSAIEPGQDVIVSGMGLAFVDLMVLLFEGRGGRFEERPDGGLDYVPSGAEPRVWAGSRRGVPYHSKISSVLRGEPVARPRYFTAFAIDALLATHQELDFRTHLWPLIAKDAGYAYYRELFTGYPSRVVGTWASFEARFDAVDWYSAEREELAAFSVRDPALLLDLEKLDHPLSGCAFADHETVQRSVAAYIQHDLNLRTSPDHSETLALFTALLYVYMDLGRLVPQERLNARSQQTIHGWWHGFFSFVDSGPPAHRLREMLALHRAGLLKFLGPGMWVRTDDSMGRFVAGTFQSPVVVDASAYIEARLPSASVERSANPALLDLHHAGWGTEQRLLTSEGSHSTGKLLVSGNHQVLSPVATAQKGLFAVGPWTSGWGAGAFARPNTNAAPFRENDALARRILSTVAATRPAASQLTSL
ncbi:FAD/NAD(P)-binding domain-containing protein [Paenarthrobacter aurescens]|uniref:Adenylate cyclase n=1 Tax=Paenarthrobacter aurescens TaxID=43663 RepID=A0A4Y3NMF7_PAEAU|nr:FAD/NAD(P)-binding protein [Paenarthrobacter aurescens]MDO6145162.1 FAD/NAD(P)-binding protein [Paenarthrobacter aurescens]MDO6149007.1 FAD/NAD(P)-binding protein [Paenarthrobacter aurescens]MDO6160253.1 FAD/NAD(P)-binding protein [Paenarthrobacter aurescens]MDO6164112.1 FAD/NAD(P)-binding protein [Paenarthrobacter aurescens]GEB20258.1 adenylate cyclase [Paenarthrobacter aurescens]